jgi:hypothetical protein
LDSVAANSDAANTMQTDPLGAVELRR